MSSLVHEQFSVLPSNYFALSVCHREPPRPPCDLCERARRKKSVSFVVFHPHALAAGASDDAVSCAVMLEVLHSLANQSTPLHHGVIFLFNGAEENVLQVNLLPGYRRQ